jgi:hypothetical protein
VKQYTFRTSSLSINVHASPAVPSNRTIANAHWIGIWRGGGDLVSALLREESWYSYINSNSCRSLQPNSHDSYTSETQLTDLFFWVLSVFLSLLRQILHSILKQYMKERLLHNPHLFIIPVHLLLPCWKISAVKMASINNLRTGRPIDHTIAGQVSKLHALVYIFKILCKQSVSYHVRH